MSGISCGLASFRRTDSFWRIDRLSTYLFIGSKEILYLCLIDLLMAGLGFRNWIQMRCRLKDPAVRKFKVPNRTTLRDLGQGSRAGI